MPLSWAHSMVVISFNNGLYLSCPLIYCTVHHFIHCGLVSPGTSLLFTHIWIYTEVCLWWQADRERPSQRRGLSCQHGLAAVRRGKVFPTFVTDQTEAVGCVGAWQRTGLCVPTFSGFGGAQLQVVPSATVGVEIGGGDPTLFLCGADEPPTCSNTRDHVSLNLKYLKLKRRIISSGSYRVPHGCIGFSSLLNGSIETRSLSGQLDWNSPPLTLQNYHFIFDFSMAKQHIFL